MGTSTENSYTIDYTAEYALLAQRLAEINHTLGELRDIDAERRDIHAELLRRASSEELGIYVRDVGHDDLSRALVINALKQSDQIESVRAEMIHPTPLP